MFEGTDLPAVTMPHPSRTARRRDPSQGLLFDLRPAWLVNPVTRIEKSFRSFHDRHPDVYARLEGVALRASARGERVSVGALAEDIRRSGALTRDGAYGLNNSYRALYARLLIHDHPALAAVIETRGRRERRPQ